MVEIHQKWYPAAAKAYLRTRYEPILELWNPKRAFGRTGIVPTSRSI